MRQLIKIIVIFLIFNCFMPYAESAIRGGVDYKINIDYSNIDSAELSAKADKCYNKALLTNSCSLDENITQGLNLYTILSNKDPQNIKYILRLGKLYDIIGKNRQAKGCYYRAMGVNPLSPEPYFFLGEYYFKRESYRKSLKMFIKASENGYANNPQTLEKLSTLHKMLGE